jgi:hypothetical protein
MGRECAKGFFADLGTAFGQATHVWIAPDVAAPVKEKDSWRQFPD